MLVTVVVGTSTVVEGPVIVSTVVKVVWGKGVVTVRVLVVAGTVEVMETVCVLVAVWVVVTVRVKVAGAVVAVVEVVEQPSAVTNA